MFLFIKTPVFFFSKERNSKFLGKRNSFLFTQQEKKIENFFLKKTVNYKKIFLTKSFFFTEHLIFQNFFMNLISNFSTKLLYKNHFFDSLTPLPIFYSFWPRNKTLNCIDIGSGGGFPGLILSLFFPNFFFCLLDSIHKKTKFQKITLKTLQIENSEPICQRAEIIGKFVNQKEAYDLTLTRAVAELDLLFKLCLPFSKKNGRLIIMKKISSINQELRFSFKALKKSNGKIKSIIHVHSLRQGKVLLLIKRADI